MALGKCIKELSCELTENERNDRAGSLALAITHSDKLEEEKRVFNADWKERKTELDQLIHRLADARNTGVEMRDVECMETWNPRTRKVDVYRTDTNSYVFSRSLDDGEKQSDFEDSSHWRGEN